MYCEIRTIVSLLFISFLLSCGTTTEEPINDESETAHSETITSPPSETPEKIENTNLTLDEKIKAIKDEFQRIESGIKSFEKKTAKLEDEDALEPIELEGYYENGEMVKMTTSLIYGHGATGKTFYLKAGELFFVLDESAEEASVMGPFTDKQVRTYLHNNEVVRVLKKEKTVTENVAIDMDKLQNVDITNEIGDRASWATELTQEYERMKKGFE